MGLLVAMAGGLLSALAGCGVSDAGAPQDKETAATGGRATSLEAKPAANPPADWPNWRGPGGKGIAVGSRLPEKWPDNSPEPIWTQALGTGWSSPVVVENRVYITDRQKNTERLLAIDAASGKPLWEVTNPVDFDPHAVGRRHGNGPKSTPVVAGNRVYSLGIAGWLQAVDAATGKVIWHVNLPEQFGRHEPLASGKAFVNGTENVIVPIGKGQGAPVPLFGYTGSLLLADRLLVLSVGGERGGTIMAFDIDDGHVVWKSLDEHPSYSSPVVADLGDVRQVVVMTGPRVVGLQLSDGRLLWSYPFQIQYDESISTPAIGDDLVLVTGDSRPLTALEIPKSGLSPDRPITPRVAWENFDLSSYLSSMLAHDGHVYGMGDEGGFVCLRQRDGKRLWSGGNHGTYCSPVLAGKQLLGLNEEGELAVLDASPQAYREIALLPLANGQTWTMPAVVGNRIFIRSTNAVSAFEFP